MVNPISRTSGEWLRPKIRHRSWLLSGLLGGLLLLGSDCAGHAAQAFAWGRNTYGQLNLPAGLTNAVAIGAGYQHCIGLRSDGQIFAWGSGTNGQNTVPAWLSNNVVAVDSGYYHYLVQLNDGSLAAWGAGQVDTGTFPNHGQSIIPANITNVLAFSAGGFF